MEITNSILRDTREAVGLTPDNSDFDGELIPYINGAISKLNQNGVGRFLVVTDETQTWEDLKDPEQTNGNRYFSSIPPFVALSTKLLFDPPPPSSVEYHHRHAAEILWRLKVCYE